jgi:H+-transporting ATPase
MMLMKYSRATLFSLFGWISGEAPHGGWTDIVTVVKLWGFSFGVTIIILLVCESPTPGVTSIHRHQRTPLTLCSDLILNKIRWLDNIGRTTRSHKNEKLENFLTDLQRLTIVHETDHTGSYYRFASGSQTPAQPQQEDKKGTGKDSKTNKKADDAKSTKSDSKGKGGAAEGDKTMSDDAGKGGDHADMKQDKGKAGQTTPTQTQTQTPAPEEEGESSGNGAREDEESSTATRVDDKA